MSLLQNPGYTRLRAWRLIPLIAAIVSFLSTAARSGERYAFLVGVRQYDRAELTSLQFAENDIADLAAVLGRAGYDSKNVVVMTQKRGASEPRFAPTCENIKREMLLVLDETSQEDSVLVALSGHGIQFSNDDTVYFCPSDTKLNDSKTLISQTEGL